MLPELFCVIIGILHKTERNVKHITKEEKGIAGEEKESKAPVS